MTYRSAEGSVASGKPVELYDIAMGITHWRLASGGKDITYATHTYTSAPCKRTEKEQTEEVQKDSVEVELPRGHAIGLLCVPGVPDEGITLTLYRGHPPFYITYFKGFLTYIEFNEENIATCTFEPRSSDLPFVGGRRRAMRLCGHLLYGYRCGVNKEVYRLTGTIDSISGLTITATEFGAASDIPNVYGDLTALPGCTYVAKSEALPRTGAKNAFDDDHSSNWTSNDPPQSQWIYCKWTSAQKIKKIRVRPQNIGSLREYSIRYFRVAGSNNGSVWTTIDAVAFYGNCRLYTGQGGLDTRIIEYDDPSHWISITLDNNTSYTYYRLFIFDNWGGPIVVFCNEIEMIEADDTMSAYFFGAGGVVVIGTARRTITAQVGNTITINRPFGSSVIAGDSFYAYPGCGHTPSECITKYDNMLNYGGQTHLPVQNPYDDKLYY